MKEEVLMSIANCSSSSSLGKLNVWTNELPSKVLSSASDIFISVATSSLQHTKDLDVRNCTGRCQCGVVSVEVCMKTCYAFLGDVYDIKQMRDINMIVLFHFALLLLMVCLVRLNILVRFLMLIFMYLSDCWFTR